MADKGILFSAPMVHALLDGRKTQTRRLLRNPEYFGCPTGDCPHETQAECDVAMAGLSAKDKGYAPGDRLWVRETWRAGESYDDVPPSRIPSNVPVDYVAAPRNGGPAGKTRVSIFMPRWASRITLTVTDVRVERLQAISEADARAEGVIELRSADGDGMRHFGTKTEDAVWPTARRAYRALWNSLHDKPGERWDDDPWVVAVSFDVREGNIDA